MIIIMGVRTFSLKAYPNFVILDQFFVIYSPNKCSDSRTNLKLSHNCIINYGTTKKNKPFQEQQRQHQKMKIRTHVQKLRLNIN